MAEDEEAAAAAFLTQVADTADVDLDLTSAKFEWGTSKFVKECATKADVPHYPRWVAFLLLH